MMKTIAFYLCTYLVMGVIIAAGLHYLNRDHVPPRLDGKTCIKFLSGTCIYVDLDKFGR